MMIPRFYAALLRFYPRRFRSEFGEEMQSVFEEAVTGSPARGRMLSLFLRELRDLPGSVFREHLRARRLKMQTYEKYDETPLARRELLAAMIFFLLPLLSVLTITEVALPQWVNYILLVFFWGCILYAIGLALAKRLPRWSLPYLGFILAIGIVVSGTDRFWVWIFPTFTGVFGSRSVWPLPVRIIYVGIFGFIMMVMILLAALASVNLLRLLPYTRVVWQRIRADWTQLSFMLYGVLVFDIVLTFDEYRYEDVWKFMAWACLAAGAWFYLRGTGQKQRILALIYAASGAKWIVALAKWVLIPLQKWPDGYPIAPSETTRWVETGSALVEWVWILLMLLAPALLNFLPRTPDPVTPKGENPVSV